MADNTSTSRSDGTRPGQARRAQRVRPTELDRLIHSRVRLGIMSALAAGNVLSFNDLRDLLDTSDGNLSVHARKLEDAGYVESIKSFDGRMPKTEYKLTPEGHDAFAAYVRHMERILDLSRPG